MVNSAHSGRVLNDADRSVEDSDDTPMLGDYHGNKGVEYRHEQIALGVKTPGAQARQEALQQEIDSVSRLLKPDGPPQGGHNDLGASGGVHASTAGSQGAVGNLTSMPRSSGPNGTMDRTT